VSYLSRHYELFPLSPFYHYNIPDTVKVIAQVKFCLSACAWLRFCNNNHECGAKMTTYPTLLTSQTLPTSPGKQELLDRIQKLHSHLLSQNSDWDAAIVVDKVSQFYYTDTVQNGLFFLLRDGSYAYFVRKSFERAQSESPLDNIYPMHSYKDAFAQLGKIECGYLETEIVPVAMLGRLQKYFGLQNILSLDGALKEMRSVKSAYELAIIEESGRQHRYYLDNIVPKLLKEGISEPQFVAESYQHMVKLGYQGLSRFSMFQTEFVLGQIGFGDSSLQPCRFDGPGGCRGINHAIPTMGSSTSLLKRGDLVFVDVGYGIGGYHTDSTQVYIFGAHPSPEMIQAHQACLDIEIQAAAQLKPGAIPSQIYADVYANLSPEFQEYFMGYTSPVKFLGHGVGLYVDEFPVIAPGFDQPLQENMVIALEPKKGLTGIGMVGVEDTYLVTPQGGRCLTGGQKEIIVVDYSG
jgi:Xaa-Pro aminopeptidase